MLHSLLFFRSPALLRVTFCLALSFFFLNDTFGQTRAACQQVLRDARESYEVGHLIKVTRMMDKCMNNFSRDEKIEALKLIIQSYIFQDNLTRAEDKMVELLTVAPDFRPDPEADPAELINLFNKYRTRPVYSASVMAGGNLTSANIVDLRQISGSTRDNVDVTPKLNFQIGAYFDALIWEAISGQIGVNYKFQSFEMTDRPYNFESNTSTNSQANQNFTAATILESQSWIEIPVSFKYTFTENNIRPYVFIGFTTAFLVDATADYNLDHLNPPDDTGFNFPTQEDQILNDINLKELDMRATTNVSLNFGAGVKIKNGINHWVIEVRAYNGLTNLSENKYANQNLTFNQFYVDSDFGINNISFSVGHMWNFYKIKKLR